MEAEGGLPTKSVHFVARNLLIGATIGLAAFLPLVRVAQLSDRLLLLASLALIAELWPVSIFRRGLRMTFTLPFIIGVAVYGGPGLALLVDGAVSLTAALALRYALKQRFGLAWVGINTAIAMLSSSMAGVAWLIAHGSVKPIGFGFLWAVAAYVVVYAAMNYVLVAWVDRALTRTTVTESFMQNWRPNLQTVALYFLVAVMVAILVRTGHAPWAAMTLAPIAALRHATKAHAQYYDHYYETITALTMMLQRVHPYTLGHLKRVAAVAEEVALGLGLSLRRARWVREAAILHDIGKIAIDEEILDKPSKLTDEEFAHVRMHADFGAQILEPVESFHPIVKWIRHHHERPDGGGYPDQLSDSEIPIESKIIAVVDAFDAMTGGEGKDKRSYREPMTSAEALEELRRCSGTQFDDRVVRTFQQVVLAGRWA